MTSIWRTLSEIPSARAVTVTRAVAVTWPASPGTNNRTDGHGRNRNAVESEFDFIGGVCLDVSGDPAAQVQLAATSVRV
jgi:hypothetical protein